jgi:hypothetical protein
MPGEIVSIEYLNEIQIIVLTFKLIHRFSNSTFKLFPFRDLSNNSLNGPLPNFLMQLRSLKVL